MDLKQKWVSMSKKRKGLVIVLCLIMAVLLNIAGKQSPGQIVRHEAWMDEPANQEIMFDNVIDEIQDLVKYPEMSVFPFSVGEVTFMPLGSEMYSVEFAFQMMCIPGGYQLTTVKSIVKRFGPAHYQVRILNIGGNVLIARE